MIFKRNICLSILLLLTFVRGQYSDQHYVLYTNEIFENIENNDLGNIVKSPDGLYLQLADGATQGFIELKPQTSDYPFNRGLPSWNGLVTDDNSGFHIQMRFPYNGVWPKKNDWYTIGYWEEYIWNQYGYTNFPGGKIDIDLAVLYSYQSEWQFRVNMKRQSANDPSPKLNKLSFFISDSKSENNIEYNAIVNDNPGFIYCETDYIYQYDVDPNIGGDICSPTSTTMALKSFRNEADQSIIEIDALTFAQDNYDTYHGLFGVWPNAVQNASEYRSIDGQYRVDGAVTRYRTWSDAYDVLSNGGRIVISVGPPLYTGHLMMLAGFMEDGRVIVHDPAAKPKKSGYQKIWDKYQLSKSWFDKGGISYTFYLVENDWLSTKENSLNNSEIESFKLHQNFPNPFNSNTTISFTLSKYSDVEISIFDISGRIIDSIYDDYTDIGTHQISWNANELASGTYYIVSMVNDKQQLVKAALIK